MAGMKTGADSKCRLDARRWALCVGGGRHAVQLTWKPERPFLQKQDAQLHFWAFISEK